MMNQKKGDLLLLLAAAIGGTGFVSIKYLLDHGFTPFQVIIGRFLIAVLFLCLIYWKQIRKITLDEWKAGFVAGGLLFLLFALMTVGLKYTTPSVNAFLTNTPAVMVPFLCWIFFRKKPTKYYLIAGLITIIGVGLLSVTDDFSFDYGAMLSLASAFAFALQMTLMGEYTQKYNTVSIALAENISMLLFAVVAVLVEGHAMPSITTIAIGNLILLGVFCTGLYFLFMSVGQKYTTASKTAIIISSESVFAAIFAAMLGERLTLRGYIGCVLIFMAIIVAENPFHRKKQALATD